MRISLIVLAAALSLISGCVEREQLTLEGGYEIVRVYGDAHALIGPDGYEVVMPNVVDVVDNQTYIMGLRLMAEPKPKLPDSVEDQPYGYFLYNKSNGDSQLGLSRERLVEILNSKDIDLPLAELQAPNSGSSGDSI